MMEKVKNNGRIVTIVILTMALAILPLESYAQETAKVYGKAGIIMKSGDVKPVAKKNFVLLPFNLRELNLKLWEEGKKYVGPEPAKIQAGDSVAMLTEKTKKSDEYRDKLMDYRQKKIREEIQKAKDQKKYVEFRTDFDGSYEVVVPPGSWYICSFQDTPKGIGFFVEVGNSLIIWAVPITVNEGQALKLDLENDNASYISN